MAWCSSFDGLAGVGILVDLHDGRRVDVCRTDLRAAASVTDYDRVLHPGEFVEYDASMVDDEVGADGRIGWVSGIMEWPLMCESMRRGAELAGASGR